MDLGLIILGIASLLVLFGTWSDLLWEGISKNKLKRKKMAKVITTIIVIASFFFSRENIIHERVISEQKRHNDSLYYAKIDASYRSQIMAGQSIDSIKAKSKSIIGSLGILDTSLKGNFRLANNNLLQLKEQSEELSLDNNRQLNAIKQVNLTSGFVFSSQSKSAKKFVDKVIQVIEKSEEFKAKMLYENSMLKSGDTSHNDLTLGYEMGDDFPNGVYFEYKLKYSDKKKNSYSYKIINVHIPKYSWLNTIPDLMPYNPGNSFFGYIDDTTAIMSRTLQQYRGVSITFSHNSLTLYGVDPNFSIDIDINNQEITISRTFFKLQIANSIGKIVTRNDLTGDTISVRSMDQMNFNDVLVPEKISGINLGLINETGLGSLILDSNKFLRHLDGGILCYFKAKI